MGKIKTRWVFFKPCALRTISKQVLEKNRVADEREVHRRNTQQ
jgi:hypothetical protein